MKRRYITLVDSDGCLAAIFSFAPDDHRYDDLQGKKLGSTSMTDEDRAHLMEAYGAALVYHDRQHVSYKWTADKGVDRLEIDVVRFPGIQVSALLLSEVIPIIQSPIKLTRREELVVQLAAADHTDAEIAKKLKIAKSTVARHKQNIRAKVGTKEWAAAVVRVLGCRVD